jgi:hypothetical protein
MFLQQNKYDFAGDGWDSLFMKTSPTFATQYAACAAIFVLLI